MFQLIMKYLIFALCGGALGWHFMAIGLTIAPINPATMLMRPYVDFYIDYTPLFAQSWKFFAPDPPMSDNFLYYRCQIGPNQWDSWKDPGRKLIDGHHSNRATYKGKLVYIYYEMARGLRNKALEIVNEMNCNPDQERECREIYDSKMIKTKEYRLAWRFVTDLCQKQYKSEFEQVEFRTVEFTVPEFIPFQEASAVSASTTASTTTSISGASAPKYFIRYPVALREE